MADCAPPLARLAYHNTFSRCFLFLFALSAALVAPAAAQVPRLVTGVVTDSSGGVLPGATVEALRGLRVLAAATAGVDVRYRLELSADKVERVTARLAGFAPAHAVLTVDSGAATVDFRLQGIPCETIAH